MNSQRVVLVSSGANTPPSRKIHCSHKMWPFFQHALRDIDGSHIPCAPPPTECTLYHNHKGFLSQNCLFACSFNLKFVFGYTGWEGSAMDNQVWEVALECRLNILGSHYFLADAGYADYPQLLLPYCGIQYHLAEWNQASQKVGHCSTSGTQYCPFLQATKQGGIV